MAYEIHVYVSTSFEVLTVWWDNFLFHANQWDCISAFFYNSPRETLIVIVGLIKYGNVRAADEQNKKKAVLSISFKELIPVT